MEETASMDDRSEIANMKKLMLDTKVGNGKQNVWQMTLETFGMADGKNKRDDVLVDSIEVGLELLEAYVTENKKTSPNLMDNVPLSEFNATQDDFLRAFLKWAEKDVEEGAKKINVTKARRRLDAYFEWMKENQGDLKDLTVHSVHAAAKIWDIQITYDEQGRFCWWIDLGSLDKEAIQKLENSDHLRYVVWFSHFVMLDKKAQENGAIIIEDMGLMGFFKLATLFPTDLSAKMDRLTIGILPVKMKAIYVFRAARWMSLLMALMKPFMGKKMRERMVLVPKQTDMQTFCDELVARKNIPKDFCGIQGEATRDAVFNKHLNKEEDC